MDGTDPDPWTEHVTATLDALWEAMGAQSPFPWAPPGGLSEEKTSNEEQDMTTYTAAIATTDVLGDYCDVTVLKDDDDGNLTDEVAMATTEIPVRTDDEDVLGKVEAAAEKALAQAGWKITGRWSVAANALYAEAAPVA